MRFVVVSDIFVWGVRWVMPLKICDCWIFSRYLTAESLTTGRSLYMHPGDDARVHLTEIYVIKVNHYSKETPTASFKD